MHYKNLEVDCNMNDKSSYNKCLKSLISNQVGWLPTPIQQQQTCAAPAQEIGRETVDYNFCTDYSEGVQPLIDLGFRPRAELTIDMHGRPSIELNFDFRESQEGNKDISIDLMIPRLAHEPIFIMGTASGHQWYCRRTALCNTFEEAIQVASTIKGDLRSVKPPPSKYRKFHNYSDMLHKLTVDMLSE